MTSEIDSVARAPLSCQFAPATPSPGDLRGSDSTARTVKNKVRPLVLSPKGRRFALFLGIACHTVFLVTVLLMADSLYYGLQLDTPLHTVRYKWVWNSLLLLQFPLLHSFLLSDRGRRWLRLIVPEELGSALDSTVFALFASVQLFLVFGLWAASDQLWWTPKGTLGLVSSCLYGASWLFLLVSLANAGLALQTGYLGWSSARRGVHPSYGSFPTRGLFRVCRQPVYLAFICIVWSAPTWSPDHLLLAIVWTGYCIAGPLLKEARFGKYYGVEFAAYQARVPYLLPLPFRSVSRRGT